MGKYRRGRINDAVLEEMAQIVRDVKDPRVSGALITITGADVTPDFKYAKIYYSVLGANEKEEMKQIYLGLKSATGFMRSQLAQRLNLRITPELSFIEDSSISHGVEIAALINKLEFSDEPDEDPSDE